MTKSFTRALAAEAVAASWSESSKREPHLANQFAPDGIALVIRFLIPHSGSKRRDGLPQPGEPALALGAGDSALRDEFDRGIGDVIAEDGVRSADVGGTDDAAQNHI